MSLKLFLIFLLFFSVIFFVSYPAMASEEAFVRNGNIYLKNERETRQLTHSGKDRSPVLSPNKERIAFVRIGNQVKPENCMGGSRTEYGDQIWIYDISLKKEDLLVQNNFKCDSPEEQIVDLGDLLFSLDNKVLYFLSSAWVTSDALHSVQVDNKKLSYIAPANEVNIVTKGKNKGDLIVYQHRYFVAGGTYDWYWLMSPKGKVEGPIGPEITKDQMGYIESE